MIYAIITRLFLPYPNGAFVIWDENGDVVLCRDADGYLISMPDLSEYVIDTSTTDRPSILPEEWFDPTWNPQV